MDERIAADHVARGVRGAVKAGLAGARRMVARLGTLRVRLTIAVAVLSTAGFLAGGALLVRAVETTVVQAIEDQSRAELHVIGGQIARGVPLSAIRTNQPWRQVSFLRPDGSRVETRWYGQGDPGPPPGPPALRSLLPGPVPPGMSMADQPPGPQDDPPGPPEGSDDRAAPVTRPIPPAPLDSPQPPGPGRPGRPGESVQPCPAPPGAAVPGVPPCSVPPDLAGDPDFPGLAAGRFIRAVRPGPGGTPGLWSVVDMPLMSPSDGPLHAVALSPLEDVLRSTQTLQRVLAVGVPVLVILLTLAAWVLIGRALRPVRVMTHYAAGIADATAPGRLTVPPIQDELGELAHTLNGMLDRLAEGARRQREFVSDASHELRSPIAAARTQVEVALAHPDRSEPATVLRGVLAETMRLELLVADLLALARLDERHTLPHEELDLDDVVLEDAARARAVAIDTRNVTAVKVRGERKSLGHLVRNLLDNAARHAVSRVEVSTRLDDGVPVLIVDDDGPGIPEPDRTRVFERFTRLSSSRSRDGGGAGLGLALVQRIAEQHGGIARVDRSPHGGARLEVRFSPDADRHDARGPQ
jgi:signal transduction histidine kinase